MVLCGESQQQNLGAAVAEEMMTVVEFLLQTLPDMEAVHRRGMIMIITSYYLVYRKSTDIARFLWTT